MWTQYDLADTEEDCKITLKLPGEMVDLLAERAKIFGRRPSVEMKLRLIRSLASDEMRDQTDAILEAIYYYEEKRVIFKAKNGGSCRIRTYDQLVKSQLLYRLS